MTCPLGFTVGFQECYAPFRYCPMEGCGRGDEAESTPVPTYLDGLRDAAKIVEKQTNLADLVHFDRPSDFRKGVLTCLMALTAAIEEATADARPEVEP